jgi:hypothetical protein
MESALGIGVLIAFAAAYFAYASWLTKGIRARQFTTRLSVEQLHSLFGEKVARAGWKVIDDGNPMIAQSSLATGIRQQIAMVVQRNQDGTCTVNVGPQRWVTKWGVPKKAHTIRLRLDSFVTAVKAVDASVAPVSVG